MNRSWIPPPRNRHASTASVDVDDHREGDQAEAQRDVDDAVHIDFAGTRHGV